MTRSLANFLASIAALALVLLTPAPAQAQGRDSLTIGISQFPSTLHPNIDSMAAKHYVLAMINRPLTQFDTEWEPVCFLCVKLPLLEDGDAEIVEREDGTRGVKLTYSIDPDAVWDDGTPVSTDDVLFTWEVGRHPESGISNAELYRRMLDIEVIDDKTFTVEDEKLTFNYFLINDFRLLPAHLERPIFESDPPTYRNRTLYDTAPSTPGLSMGPYRIKEVASGSYIVLERNERWWGETPAFDEVIVRTIENSAALEANLLSGAVDMLDGVMGLSLDQALALEQRRGDDYQIVFETGLVYEHIDLNLDNPILSDRRVRQALLLGLDREALTQQLFAGRQPVAHSNVSPLDRMHAQGLKHYAYDPDEARRLLEEAGWQGSGIRRNAQGQPLRLTLMTTAGDRTRELVQQVLQSMWREIGIDVVIENEPARVLFGETLTKRRFDGMVLFAWISSPENVPRSTLHSEEIPSSDNDWTGQNYTGFSRERADELIDAIEIELDEEARSALWTELQELYVEELPALPLYFRANAHIWPLWLEGVEPSGHLAPTTLGIEHWRVSEGS